MSSEEKITKDDFLRLKKQKKALILAHNYQLGEIQDLADYLGDSLELAKVSREVEAELIVFCGVTFMAETAKILSPEKKVLLPVKEAGCPLADTISPSQLIKLKQDYPEAWVVSYVNTSAEIKALSDVCCTSANAVSVVKNIPVNQVIFVPDKNLGWWVKKNVPEKDIILWQGGCFVHEQFKESDVDISRKNYPNAEILVHPECNFKVLEKSDKILSTGGMVNWVKQSSAKTFVIGTEQGMIYRLGKENPEKTFYSLGMARLCRNMKMTTFTALYNCLKREEFEMNLEPEIMVSARVALERMVQYV
ncbi:MAG: quinolinate synthase NadA [Candidatus Omnitrophica bacterium]|nr:quinolinate synthase NadA [Candidatus Omnitrophota bacterium]